MRTTSRLSEMQRHRALEAGERLGEALLALSRWVSRLIQALRAPLREQAHTPR